MNWHLEIRPEALADIDEAAAWYEGQQSGLGADFARTVSLAISALTQNPHLHPVRDRRRRARWFFPPRFPYRIVYRAEDSLITIVAVVHAARRDRHWKQRL